MDLIKDSTQVVKEIQIDQFILNENNINEMSEDDLVKLCQHISEVGFLGSILAVPTEEGKFLILGGEHRWKAAKRLGMTYVPTTILTDEKWNDSDVFDLTAFRLNVTRGSQNPEKFLKLYEKLALKFGADSLKEVFAVTDKSLWKKLTKSIKTDLKKSGVPDETIDKINEADKKSKDFNQFTKYMNKIFSDQTQMTNGTILFSSSNNEHLIVNANQKVFDLMKALSSLALSQSKNVNDYLEPALTQLMRNLV